MATPKNFQLDRAQFPDSDWATSLVPRLNQFVTESVKAFGNLSVKYKLLTIQTTATPADSFPIDFVPEILPLDIHIAQIVTGSDGVTAYGLNWGLLTDGSVTITNISGLAPNTEYVIRLALQN